MIMLSIGRPLPHHNFNGKILLERVSKKCFIQKSTSYSAFSNDVLLNADIKDQKLRCLVIVDLKIAISKTKNTIFDNYN